MSQTRRVRLTLVHEFDWLASELTQDHIEELKEELVTNPHQFIWPQDDDEVTYIHVEDITEETNALLV